MVQENSRYEDENESSGFGQGLCVSYSLLCHFSCLSGVFLAELQIFIIMLWFFSHRKSMISIVTVTLKEWFEVM